MKIVHLFGPRPRFGLSVLVFPDGVIVLDHGAALPDGTCVQVTPMSHEAGSPQAVIAAMEAEPHLSPEDVAELRRVIASGLKAINVFASLPVEPVTAAAGDVPKMRCVAFRLR